jgi:hypothetical protein
MTLDRRGGGGMERFLPWFNFGVFLVYLAAAMFRPARSREGFNLAEFGRLPLLMNGRVQPIDSVARLGLFQIRGTTTVPLEKTGLLTRGSLGATEWLLEVMTKPDAADARHIFPIQDPTLLRTLDLKRTEGSGPIYYTFRELEPRLAAIGTQTLEISSEVNAASRSEWQREVLRLRNRLAVYQRLKNSLQPNTFLQHEAQGKPIAYDFAAGLSQYQIDLRVGVQAAIARNQGKEQQALDPTTAERMRTFARPFAGVSRAGVLAIVPPAVPASSRDRWRGIGTALVDSARTGQLAPAVAHFAGMSSAFARGRPAIFNLEVTKYRQWLTTNGLAPEVSKARYEFFNNLFQPFVRATALYLVAFFLACAFCFKRSTVLYRSAVMLVVLACVVHTAGLLFGMMLEGRPPVTNAYSSIIFSGWGVVLLAGTVERFSRNGIGMATAALAGLIAIGAAHRLAPGGATALVQNVLDIPFVVAILAIVIARCVGRDTKTASLGTAAAMAAA